MTSELALVPQFIIHRGNRVIENFASIFLGIAGITLLAQLSISLPWTPVPITGQTFGVALVGLMWGRLRGVTVVLSYLGLGALGLPVFAGGHAGVSMGPTIGYLIGMVLAAGWMGWLSDLGWTKNFVKSYLAALSGSVIVILCGVTVLSFFVPTKSLFIAGVLPFLPGDFIKTLLASTIAYRAQKSVDRN